MQDTASPPVKTPGAVCVLPWCTARHIYSRDLRGHASDRITGGHGLYARITWDEPLTATARAVDQGAVIFLGVGDASMRFPVRGAADLALVLRESGAVDVSEFVGRVITVAAGEDDGDRRG
jgi:hypothetical protein